VISEQMNGAFVLEKDGVGTGTMHLEQQFITFRQLNGKASFINI
jgi:hypothetical protein